MLSNLHSSQSQEQVMKERVGTHNSISRHHFLGAWSLECYSGLARKINDIQLGEGGHIRECVCLALAYKQQSTVLDTKHTV